MLEPARLHGLRSTVNCLVPTVAERLVRAQSDLSLGLPCLLKHEGRQVVVASVETLTADRFDALCEMFGMPGLILTTRRAKALGIATRGGAVCLKPSADTAWRWFRAIADPGCDVRRGANAPSPMVLAGDTELQDLAIALMKRACHLPAAVVFSVEPSDARVNTLSLVSLTAAEAMPELLLPPALGAVAAARLPLQSHDLSKLHVFRDGRTLAEHYAVEIGDPDRGVPVLSRLHSACFTGDVLGSLKCDCGPQLQTALLRMGQEGAGVLLYLNQEGRGIGLANKMRVYDLQAQGFDTVEANHRLGFEDDERDFRVAAVMLRTLGFTAARLLTNNPAKIVAFEQNGIEITDQVPLRVGRTAHNGDYLAVKALKSGHTL